MSTEWAGACHSRKGRVLVSAKAERFVIVKEANCGNPGVRDGRDYPDVRNLMQIDHIRRDNPNLSCRFSTGKYPVEQVGKIQIERRVRVKQQKRLVTAIPESLDDASDVAFSPAGQSGVSELIPNAP